MNFIHFLIIAIVLYTGLSEAAKKSKTKVVKESARKVANFPDFEPIDSINIVPHLKDRCLDRKRKEYGLSVAIADKACDRDAITAHDLCNGIKETGLREGMDSNIWREVPAREALIALGSTYCGDTDATIKSFFAWVFFMPSFNKRLFLRNLWVKAKRDPVFRKWTYELFKETIVFHYDGHGGEYHTIEKFFEDYNNIYAKDYKKETTKSLIADMQKAIRMLHVFYVEDQAKK